MDVVETTIIGAGVVGTAVAHELSKNGREVFVIERNPCVTQGKNQSSRNTGVIHSGLYYDQATRPLTAKLCVPGYPDALSLLKGTWSPLFTVR
jgi:L-2-hydroxyglutarate oxidase